MGKNEQCLAIGFTDEGALSAKKKNPPAEKGTPPPKRKKNPPAEKGAPPPKRKTPTKRKNPTNVAPAQVASISGPAHSHQQTSEADRELSEFV